MLNNEQTAFTCVFCEKQIVVNHVPPTTPSCASCGADTRPNKTMSEKAGTLKCVTCGSFSIAYKNERCPQCDGVYGTFNVKDQQSK